MAQANSFEHFLVGGTIKLHWWTGQETVLVEAKYVKGNTDAQSHFELTHLSGKRTNKIEICPTVYLFKTKDISKELVRIYEIRET